MKQSFLAAISYGLIASQITIFSSCGKQPRHRPDLPERASANQPPLAGSATININEASPRELEILPGIGKGLAERIVAHRERYGPFRRVEHLMMVRGLSEGKFRELQSLISVE